jgi:hypothetical protein
MKRHFYRFTGVGEPAENRVPAHRITGISDPESGNAG